MELIERLRACPDIAHARIVAPGDRVPEQVVPSALLDKATARIEELEKLAVQQEGIEYSQCLRIEALERALEKSRLFAVLFLAFSNRDRDTDRMTRTLDDLTNEARRIDDLARATLKGTPHEQG